MKWYEILAKANETHATITVYDEIGGWGVSGKRFVEELKALSADTIDLYINSPGGSVFDALLMFNGLKASGKTINVKIMGIAASAASYLAMAGDTISMPKNTFQFVHNALGALYGNADDMRDFAEVLDKITKSLKATYAKRTGLDEAKLTELFDKESYLSAEECQALGLCDEVTEEIEATARFDFDRPDLPANVKAVFEAAKARANPTPEPKPTPAKPAASLAAQIKAAVEAAGLIEFKDTFLADTKLTTMEAAQAAIDVACEIKELCVLMDRPDDAKAFIVARRTYPEAREGLATILAANDQTRHTSNVIRQPAANAPASQGGGVALKPSAIWAATHAAEAKSRNQIN